MKLIGRRFLPALPLLERSARLSGDNGSGSLTALPIRDPNGGVAGYIRPTSSPLPTVNFLETDLFNKGIRPAVSVGLSVSRVGSAAQIKATKVAGKVNSACPVQELAAFSQFESDLDAATKAGWTAEHESSKCSSKPPTIPFRLKFRLP